MGLLRHKDMKTANLYPRHEQTDHPPQESGRYLRETKDRRRFSEGRYGRIYARSLSGGHLFKARYRPGAGRGGRAGSSAVLAGAMKRNRLWEDCADCERSSSRAVGYNGQMRSTVVSLVFLLRSDSLLLLRRNDTGFEDGKYCLPGGHLEDGESVRQAAIRECREEIGIELAEPDLHVIGVTHYRSGSGDGVDVFLSADRWVGEPKAVSECDALRWCPVDRLPDRTIPFIRRAAVCHLKNGVWFDEIGWDE